MRVSLLPPMRVCGNNHEHEEAKNFSHERFTKNTSVRLDLLGSVCQCAGSGTAEGAARAAAERQKGLGQEGEAAQGRTTAGRT